MKPTKNEAATEAAPRIQTAKGVSSTTRTQAHLTPDHVRLLKASQLAYGMLLEGLPSESLLIRRAVELLALRATEAMRITATATAERAAMGGVRKGEITCEVFDEKARAEIAAGLEQYLMPGSVNVR